jgi:hypothetical protein
VLGDQDEGDVEHGGEVEPFVEVSRGGAAVADVGQGHEVLLLHAAGQGDPGHDRDERAEHGDRGHEPALEVAEVGVDVLAARGAAGPGHVLHHDFARLDAADEHGAEIADERPDDVLGTQGVGAAHGDRLLPAAGVEAAHHLALAVEVAQPVFGHPVELQVAVDLELRLAGEVRRRQPVGRLVGDRMERAPVPAQLCHGLP